MGHKLGAYMNRLLAYLFLILLILTSSAYAQDQYALAPGILGNAGAAGAAASCASSCAGTETWIGNPGANEGFEKGVGDWCCTEWSETDASSILSTYNNADKHCGTYSMSVTSSGNSQTASIEANLGSNSSEWATRFYYKTPASFDSGNSITIFAGQKSTRGNRAKIIFRIASSVPGIGVQSDTAGPTYNTSVAVATWYRIELTYKANTADTGANLAVFNATTGAQIGSTISISTGADDLVQYPMFGQIECSATTPGVHYFDDLKFWTGGGTIPLGAE